MNIEEILRYLDDIDEGQALPQGLTEKVIIKELVSKIDGLAIKSDELKYNVEQTKDRATAFRETAKVCKNEFERFKERMVFCFKEQEGKKFPGKDFVANIVRKFTWKPKRLPTFDDYSNPKRHKFVVAGFEWKQEPNADVFTALKNAGFEEYCGFKFYWDKDAIKACKDESEISDFCELIDSSYVQFKPKKG